MNNEKLEKQYIELQELKQTKIAVFNAQLNNTIYLIAEILDGKKELSEDDQWQGDKRIETGEHTILRLLGEIKDDIHLIINKR